MQFLVILMGIKSIVKKLNKSLNLMIVKLSLKLFIYNKYYTQSFLIVKNKCITTPT